MSKRITLVDYGMANLLNVARAFQHCGADIDIIEDPKAIKSAERLVVPGVGAFKDCIDEIRTRGFDDAIKQFTLTERPLLGICVGMQILFESSEEFGQHAGLGILPGQVKAIPKQSPSGKSVRVPHIGWSHLVKPETGRNWSETLLDAYEGKAPAVYFVHSFAAHPAHAEDRLADCIYGDQKICASVQRDNLMATQFHPERSGPVGLSLINRFMSL